MSSQPEVVQPSNEQLWATCSQLFEPPHSGATLEESYWYFDTDTPYALPLLREQQVVLKQASSADNLTKYIVAQLTTSAIDRPEAPVVYNAFFGLIQRPDEPIMIKQRLQQETRADLDETGRAMLSSRLARVSEAVRYRKRHRSMYGQ